MSMFWASCQNHSSAPRPPILDSDNPDLVVFYTMDNISGSTLVDETPNANNAVITNTTFSPGKFSNQAVGNGSSSFVRINNTAAFNINQGALSFWMDMSIKGIPLTLANSSSNNGYYQIGVLNRSGIDVAWYQLSSPALGNFFLKSTTAVPSSGFSHFVFQSDGAIVTIFINGVQQTTTAEQGSNTGQFFSDLFTASGVDNVEFFRLGRSSPGYYVAGLDQFRLFNRPLLQSEITQLFNDDGLVIP